MDNSIFKKTEDHVSYLFAESNPKLEYHNLEHTVSVVRRAHEISGNYQLSEEDTLALFLASWFHDTGYINGEVEGHEERGIQMMRQFATEHSISEEVIEKAAQCILATTPGSTPVSLLGQILRDADTYNLGTDAFWETNKNVYKEWQRQNPNFGKDEFRHKAYNLLANHEYYTLYAKENLDAGLKKNMKKLKKLQDKKTKKGKTVAKNDGLAVSQTSWVSDGVGDQITEITEKAGTTKGMQTMLRVTSANHVQLSEMADSKANILISVNAIIISVILSVLLRKLQTDPYLTVPTLIFLTFSVVTIVLSILATRPKLNSGIFDEDDVINKRTNLLFFGNFHRMSLQKYETGMRTMMQDSDLLYSSMIKDIYNLGIVLGRKYKLIRWAYTIFMIGIILSVIAFAAFTVLYSPADAPAASQIGSGSPF